MRREMSPSRRRIESVVIAVIIGWSLASPLRITPQNTCPAPSQGQNAVYNPTCTNEGPVVGSPSFIDASMFAGATFCSTIYSILSGSNGQTYPSNGAVVDARALNSGNTNITCASGTTPWNNGNTFVNVPSTILLPATGGTPIKISTTWILPANTHLIGEGDGITGMSFTSGTTIRAASSFSGSMIQFGPTTCLPQPNVPSTCQGISVERLTLDGNAQAINGITNALVTTNSYVDHVSLYRILGTGRVAHSSPVLA